MSGKVKKEMTLGEVVTKHPVAAEVMMQRGLHCIGCGVASFETIEQGAMAHGMGKEETEKMIE
ncbi:MAG: DUF1858 domain-containing protein, partial [Candidatus Diapherotrites archaeon]|nr:DUF1858 domain-containing protein [Candidatus Diapherotrites archaeon]